MPALSELFLFLVALLVAGGVAGVLAGLFGIGGGAVLVPVFYQMLGIVGVDEAIRMHLSVGTSLAIIVPTSVQSYAGHLAKGAVDTRVLRSFAIPVPVGVVAASAVAAFLSSGNLRLIFAVFALIVAVKLLFARDTWRLPGDMPEGLAAKVTGFLIGFFSTFMGIGGGVFNNTFMTMFGRPMHQAVATSAGVGVLISIPGMIGYMIAGWNAENLPAYSIGYVNLLMVAMIIPVTLLVAPIGVQFAHALEKRKLEILFGLFLVLVSIRFFASLL